jgi:uncharacterized protein (TIGR03435 family)
MRACLLIFSACCLASGQQFEAATIKQPPPPNGNFIRMGMNGGPGTSDPGRINYENVNLKMVLAKAYGVQNYQISGPDWLDSERFNIAAKLPDGATKEQFLVMLQNLLIERFKMALHREKKDLPAYALLVAKNGPKLKASSADPTAPEPGPPTGRMVMGKDGFPAMPAGHTGMMAMLGPGGIKMTAGNQSMPELVEWLADKLGRPVTDLTGLTGKYDLTLYFSMEGLVLPPPPPGAMGGPMPPPSSDSETAPSLLTALQEQLGLRLESKKLPLDLIVIDHIEKAPTEN